MYEAPPQPGIAEPVLVGVSSKILLSEEPERRAVARVIPSTLASDKLPFVNPFASYFSYC